MEYREAQNVILRGKKHFSCIEIKKKDEICCIHKISNVKTFTL